MATEGDRSPLKDRPLNSPGQSVDSALDNFVENHFVFPLLCVGTLCVVAIWEGIAAIGHLPRRPGAIMGVALIAAGLTALYWRAVWKRAKTLRLGRDGERVVGQFLDRYSEPDAVVFHDLPSSRGNIDHVVICSRGIYVIETKTRTKPAKGKPVVLVEDERLTVKGLAPDRNPIAQARACADDVKRILKESTGKAFQVRPVVVFPGWFIEDRRKAKPVWVLEPKALPGWVEKEPTAISAEDVRLASYHLSRYCRTHIA